MAQHGVQRHHGRHGERGQEVEDALAVIGTPDAVLVLDGDHPDAAPAQGPGDARVVGADVRVDDVVDEVALSSDLTGAAEGHDLPAADGPAQVGGEGGDAAATRRIRGDERDACHRVALLASRAPRGVGADDVTDASSIRSVAIPVTGAIARKMATDAVQSGRLYDVPNRPDRAKLDRRCCPPRCLTWPGLSNVHAHGARSWPSLTSLRSSGGRRARKLR